KSNCRWKYIPRTVSLSMKISLPSVAIICIIRFVDTSDLASKHETVRQVPDTRFAAPDLETKQRNLYLQNGTRRYSIVVIGEVLWDVFEHSRRLGGAALNFAAHAQKLGQDALLISAVGADSMGEEAVQAISALALTTGFLQKTSRFR